MSKSSIKNLDVDVQNILKNEYVCWGLRIILVLYAAMVAPNLNREVSSIFDNVIVRLIVACVIVFLSFHDTTLAILLSIAFVVSIQTLNKHKVNTITSLPESFMVNDEHNMADLRNNHVRMDNMNENFMSQDGNTSEEIHRLRDNTREEVMQHRKNMHNENFLNNSEEQQTEMEGENEGFVSGPNSETQSEQQQQPSVCGGPNNQFTTQSQLYDAANNLVNKNQVNSVATFCPELNAQGSNPPQGFGDWNSAHAVF